MKNLVALLSCFLLSSVAGVAQTIAWLKGQSADELICLDGEKTTFELPARR